MGVLLTRLTRFRGNNAEGQLGACGCGGCADYDGADTGVCVPNNSSEPACPCNCGGIGTCVYTAGTISNNFVAQNVGKCVTSGSWPNQVAKCDCSKAQVSMTGKLDIMDSPMISDLSYVKSFTRTARAVIGGGGIFAITESSCKDDVNGVQCSGRGECLADGSCLCQAGAGGDTCENVCPVATEDDELLLAASGIDELVEGLECAGHGSCDPISAKCVCEDGFYGPRCVLVCKRDAAGNICSGNGTCTYKEELSSVPYCECNRYQDAGSCARAGLTLYSSGWCSFHGGDSYGGFDACYSAGVCGDCQSPGAKWLHVQFLAALLTLLLLAIP